MDPILIAASVMRTLHLSGAEAAAAAHVVAQGEPTLREMLDGLPADEIAVVRTRYPQGMKMLLDGCPVEDRLPAGPGLGDRPYGDLNTANVKRLMDLAQERVIARQCTLNSGPRPGEGPRDGYAAARQVKNAARGLASVMQRHDYLHKDPLKGLPTPAAPGPMRDRALLESERRQFCRTVVLNAPDPVLAALVWILLVVFGAREVEIERLTEKSINAARGSILFVGKDGPRRERPIHHAFAQMLLNTMSSRPEAPGGQLLRTSRGTPVNGHMWDEWSAVLHRFQPWARGFRIGPHALRHSTTRMFKAHGYEDVDTGRWIGHHAPSAAKVDAIYTRDSSASGEWAQCVEMAEEVFGPLDGWPVLAENDILAATLGIDLPLSPPPSTHAVQAPETGRKERKNATWLELTHRPRTSGTDPSRRPYRP